MRKAAPDGVECCDPFQALFEARKDYGEHQERRADGKSLPTGNILVGGDSQVKFLNRSFCARDMKHIGPGFAFQGRGLGMSLVSDGRRGSRAHIVCPSVEGNAVDMERALSAELQRGLAESCAWTGFVWSMGFC